jgi:hypothetical protein
MYSIVAKECWRSRRRKNWKILRKCMKMLIITRIMGARRRQKWGRGRCLDSGEKTSCWSLGFGLVCGNGWLRMREEVGDVLCLANGRERCWSRFLLRLVL